MATASPITPCSGSPTAQYIIRLMNADGSFIPAAQGGVRIVQFGTPGNLADIPIPGDYDGNGVTDYALFRVATAQYIIRLMNADGSFIPAAQGGVRIVQFGTPGNLADIPIPGDYDGNGVTDYALFRVATAQYIIRLMNADGSFIPASQGGVRIVQFGTPGNLADIPIPGDYDGNGVTDYAVFRKATAQYVIRLMNADGSFIPASQGGVRIVQFGTPGNLADVPLQAPIPALVRLGVLGAWTSGGHPVRIRGQRNEPGDGGRVSGFGAGVDPRRGGAGESSPIHLDPSDVDRSGPGDHSDRAHIVV